MKYEKLKKKAVIEACILAGVILVMGAIIYVISSICDDYEASNASLQTQVDAIDLEMKTLKGRFTNIQKNLDVYQEVEKKIAENHLAIDRKMVLEKFNQLKTRYVLDSLHLTVSPAQDVQGAIFKHKNSDVNFSEVDATFDTTSDESVYELIDSLRDELPGVTKLVKLRVTRQKPFDDQAFMEISQKGICPMIRTEMKFVWFGINYIEPPAILTGNTANATKK